MKKNFLLAKWNRKENMEIDIGGFDYSNHAHLRDANNLLDNIIDDNGYKLVY